jgi:hypothetical protein
MKIGGYVVVFSTPPPGGRAPQVSTSPVESGPRARALFFPSANDENNVSTTGRG